MTLVAFIAIVMLVLGPTVVFFAARTTGTLAVKTALAAIGFLLIAVALWLVGALG